MNEMQREREEIEVVSEEARNEGYPVPSKIAQENAWRLLGALRKFLWRRYDVYPSPDGEIVIDASGGYGRSVQLLCNSDGRVLCMVNRGGTHSRAAYPDIYGLPDEFIREAIEELVTAERLLLLKENEADDLRGIAEHLWEESEGIRAASPDPDGRNDLSDRIFNISQGIKGILATAEARRDEDSGR